MSYSTVGPSLVLCGMAHAHAPPPARAPSSSLSAPRRPHPQAVTSYFSQANPSALPYGFVPEIASLKKAGGAGGATSTAAAATAKAAAASAAVPTINSTSTTTTTTITTAAAVLPGVPAAAAGTTGSGGGGGDYTLTESTTETERCPVAKKDPAAAAFGTGGGIARITNLQQQQQLPVTEVESEEDLEAFLVSAGRGRLVLVDFGAEWCKNCKAILASAISHCRSYSFG